jgi:hypothetical protein
MWSPLLFLNIEDEPIMMGSDPSSMKMYLVRLLIMNQAVAGSTNWEFSFLSVDLETSVDFEAACRMLALAS